MIEKKKANSSINGEYRVKWSVDEVFVRQIENEVGLDVVTSDATAQELLAKGLSEILAFASARKMKASDVEAAKKIENATKLLKTVLGKGEPNAEMRKVVKYLRSYFSSAEMFGLRGIQTNLAPTISILDDVILLCGKVPDHSGTPISLTDLVAQCLAPIYRELFAKAPSAGSKERGGPFTRFAMFMMCKSPAASEKTQISLQTAQQAARKFRAQQGG